MVFSSLEFILLILLPCVCGFHFLKNKTSNRTLQLFLIIFSGLFYCFWSPYYYLLLVGYAGLGFVLGKEVSRRGKLFFIASITLCLAPLLFYKYLPWLSGKSSWYIPLGISFYTFQQIAYLSDCYKEKIYDHNCIRYFLFLSFFPQLIAGPIVHHKQVNETYTHLKSVNIKSSTLLYAISLFAFGFFKKIGIADYFAAFVDETYLSIEVIDFSTAWMLSFAYTYQLYFDFSGYCDMALGIALMLGIKLPENFKSPYRSGNISEFWRRWHITLGAFFKKYVYIPLGGNRNGKVNTLIALFCVGMLSGIWHGAGLTFVLWGLLHALGLCLHRIWSYKFRMPKILGVITTFLFVLIAWVPFRAESIDQVLIIWGAMINISEYTVPIQIANWVNLPTELISTFEYQSKGILYVLAIISVVIFTMPRSVKYLEQSTHKTAIYSLAALFISLSLLGRYSSFIYFDF
ncbi:hypothetical protein A3715_18880 [Oleiphilus sp. HI0009]|nr:hypothetical protein A3715_18880 [Oleiphilus sp. HI0009]